MYQDSGDTRYISLGFTDEKVRAGQHICYIYNDDRERRHVMGKFLESGIRENEKVLYLVDLMTPEEMLSSLEDLGIDVREKGKRLNIAEAAPTYCPEGVFDPDEMLEIIKNYYHQAIDNEGFAGVRGTGEMGWCLVDGKADHYSLMNYEMKLNQLICKYPVTACCQYDARRFDGGLILDLLKVHPVTIIRGQLVQNPYYVEPDLFVNEFRERFEG